MPPSPKSSQPAKTIFGYQAPVKPAADSGGDNDDEPEEAPTEISDPPAGMTGPGGGAPAKTIMGGLTPPAPGGGPKLPPPVSKPAVPNPASKTVFGTPAANRPPGPGGAPTPPAPGAPAAPPPAGAAPAGAAPGAPGGPPPGGPAPGGPAPGGPAPGAPGGPPPGGAFPPPATPNPGMNPAMGGQPQQQPGMPGQPQQPGMPGQPQQPGMPGQPQQPGMPGQPQMMQPGYPMAQPFGASGPLPGDAFATKVAQLLRNPEFHKTLLLIGGAAVALAVIAIPLLKVGDKMFWTWRTDSKFRLLIWPLLASATFLFVALAPPNLKQSLPKWFFGAVPWAVAGLTIGIVGWGSVYNPGPSDIEVTVRFGLPFLIAGLLLFKLQNGSNLARILIAIGGVLVLIYTIDHLANRMFKFSHVPALMIIRNLVIGLVLLVATASGALALSNQVPQLRQWERFAGPVAALLMLTVVVDILLVFLIGIIHMKMGVSAFFILLHQLVYLVGFAAVFVVTTEVGIEGCKQLFSPSPAPYGGYPGQQPMQPGMQQGQFPGQQPMQQPMQQPGQQPMQPGMQQGQFPGQQPMQQPGQPMQQPPMQQPPGQPPAGGPQGPGPGGPGGPGPGPGPGGPGPGPGGPGGGGGWPPQNQ